MSVELWLGLCLQVASSAPSTQVSEPAVEAVTQEAVAAKVTPAADESKATPTEAATVPGPEGSPPATILTVEGQSMKGELRPSIDGRIGLASSDFTKPLIIRPDRLAAINFESTKGASKNSTGGQFEVVLSDGSRLQGNIVDVSAESWLISTAGMGTFRLPTDSVMRAENLGGAAQEQAGLVYRGPTGLAGWGQKSSKRQWTIETGRLIAKEPKAALIRDLGLGESRYVTLRLSWNADPHFRLSLGVKSSGSDKGALTVEPWGSTLVAWRSGNGGMQLVELVQGLEADSTCELRFSTDENDVVFRGEDGAELGRMPRATEDGPCLRLVSDASGVGLAELNVFSDADGDPQLQRLRTEEITGVEDDGQRFLTAQGAVDAVALLGIDTAEPGPLVAEREGDLWLEYVDGRRIGGAFLGVATTGLRIMPVWAYEPVVAGWDGLTRAVVRGSEDQIKRRRSSKSFLITAQGEVAGELDSILPSGEIVWSATIAEGSATLATDAVERVVINRTSAYYVSGRKFPHLMRLRDGDRFRCIVHSIGAGSILYSSPFGKDRKVDASLVKAVEFDLRATARFAKIFAADPEPEQHWFGPQKEARRETSEGFDADSLERALALPRKYKERRFEHLVLARNGDFLRTSLIGLSPEGAVYPGASEVDRLVPKNRLAAVIWLDPTEEPAEKPKTNARVVMDENTSISMNLSSTEGGKLIGTSPILGDLEIELPHVISIDLDPEAIHTESTYSEWVLKPMKEPFPDDATASTGGPSVGQPAIETAGKDLKGEEFALADLKGQVVLLEFWGHW